MLLSHLCKTQNCKNYFHFGSNQVGLCFF